MLLEESGNVLADDRPDVEEGDHSAEHAEKAKGVLTGFGKTAPLRVMMTDLKGARLRPAPPHPAAISPSSSSVPCGEPHDGQMPTPAGEPLRTPARQLDPAARPATPRKKPPQVSRGFEQARAQPPRRACATFWTPFHKLPCSYPQKTCGFFSTILFFL